jgi:polyhydroxybutyrate depolymerase
MTCRRLAIAVSTSLLLSGCRQGAPTSPSQVGTAETIVVQGQLRTFLLYVPTAFQSSGGALVVALPGRTETAQFFQGFTNLNQKADEQGFAVAYADGLFEPASGAVNWAYYRNDFVDDVAFIKQLIATVQARLSVRPGRVFITGFSSGGFMAYRVAVEASDMVAAVGVVGGRLFREEGGVPANVPPAKGPVSVVMLQGEFDTPYCGGFEVSPLGRAYNASQDETFDYWTSADNCTRFSSTEPLCSGGQQTAVAAKTATACRGNVEVQFYKLLGGDHNWYGNPMNLSGQVPFNPQLNGATGVTTNDILWTFFNSHSR